METGWISVEDRLPENRTQVLVFVKHAIEYKVRLGYFAHGGWLNFYGGYALADVTHWQPLPEPPK